MARYTAYDWLCVVIGLFILAAKAVYQLVQNWNDERIIRSLERDVVNTARRMNKVAAR